MKHTAFIALGSNQGDRTAHILQAVELIDALTDVSVFRVSTLLETRPVGQRDQPDFVNGVVEVRTNRPPAGLLAALLDIETFMGRVRDGRAPGGPRPIDLDLLLVDHLTEEASGLSLPHPRLHERAFVLIPMVELDPDRMHPILAVSMRELLAQEMTANGPLEDRCRTVSPESLVEEPAPGDVPKS